MRTIGAHVKIADGRYVVGLSVVEDAVLLAELTYPAPADRDEAGQLNELYEWVTDAIGSHHPDKFALRCAELHTVGARADLTRHAEGVVLAGAREGGASDVSQWSRQKLIKPLGAAGKKAEDLRAAVPAHLDREPTRGVLTEAACAAVACAVATPRGAGRQPAQRRRSRLARSD
jgi:hypothetical protein